MNGFIHWASMGGYASYVWSAYGLAMAIFAMHSIRVKREHKSARKKLKQWLQ